MEYKQFTEEVLSFVTSKLGEEYSVKLHSVTKNNDSHHIGLSIRNKEQKVSPTIYLEEFYSIFDGENFELICQELLLRYQVAMDRIPSLRETEFEWEQCKQKVIFRLVSREFNLELLEETPFVPFLDLAIVFYVPILSGNNSLDAYRITKTIMEQWEITKETLLKYATANTKRLFPPKVQTIESTLENIIEDEEVLGLLDNQTPTGLLVVTNKQGLNGASVMIYDKVIESIAKLYQKDLAIIPSSIHELIVMPVENSKNLQYLNQMIRDVNENGVDPEEVLSNHAYVYDKDSKLFESVENM